MSLSVHFIESSVLGRVYCAHTQTKRKKKIPKSLNKFRKIWLSILETVWLRVRPIGNARGERRGRGVAT